MNKGKIIYEGIFLDKEDVLAVAKLHGKRLENVVETPHITTAFKPIYTMDKFYGTECDVILTAHGCDGKNEGFKAIAVSGDDVVNAIIGKVVHPHVTVSVAEGAKPVDTAELIANKKLKTCNPIAKIRGVYGAYTSDGEVITEGGKL